MNDQGSAVETGGQVRGEIGDSGEGWRLEMLQGGEDVNGE